MVDEPGQLPELLAALLRQPERWPSVSANATRLVEEQLNPEPGHHPVTGLAGGTRTRTRLPGYGLAERTPAVLGVPPSRERVARPLPAGRRVALARWFRPAAAAEANCVLMLSRGDLFPSDHGAAVKIVETARGLSRHGQEVVLVTDARDHYLRYSQRRTANHSRCPPGCGCWPGRCPGQAGPLHTRYS